MDIYTICCHWSLFYHTHLCPSAPEHCRWAAFPKSAGSTLLVFTVESLSGSGKVFVFSSARVHNPRVSGYRMQKAPRRHWFNGFVVPSVIVKKKSYTALTCAWHKNDRAAHRTCAACHGNRSPSVGLGSTLLRTVGMKKIEQVGQRNTFKT